MSDVLMVLLAFAAGGMWAGAVAWFVWIYHERRTMRIQARMFDEAARWAREDVRREDARRKIAQQVAGEDDGWAIYDERLQEVHH